MDKNNKNKKLDIASKILLVIIVLSFVFSAVALGRSCSVNTAAADTVEEKSYLTTLSPLDFTVSGASNVYALSANDYYAFSTSLTNFSGNLQNSDRSVSIIFTVTNITSTSCHLYMFDMVNFAILIDFDYYYIVDDCFVFSLRNITAGVLSDVYLEYLVSSADNVTFYSYINQVYGSIDSNNPLFDLFSVAYWEYSFSTEDNYSGTHISVQLTGTFDISPLSSNVNFQSLYRQLPSTLLSLPVSSLVDEYNNRTFREQLRVYGLSGDYLDINQLRIFNLPSGDGISSNYQIYGGPQRPIYSNDYNVNMYGYSSFVQPGVITGDDPPNPYSISISTINFLRFSYSGRLFNGVRNIIPLYSVVGGVYIEYGSQNVDNYRIGYDTAKQELALDRDRIYNQGFEAGKINGASNANEYTFFGLISAIVDAPIQAISGLLNFTFLGINLFGFFTGLLTVGLIIFVVKKILGG